MNQINTISWKAFKELLELHNNLHLQFQYAEKKMVNPAYHITEIKQAVITSVDCGGVKNEWTEIVVQLWVPDTKEETLAMTASKAISIIDVVEKTVQLNPDGLVKIEFGDAEFDTRQMLPHKLLVDQDNLIVVLQADNVQCKAQTRGGTCGTNDKGEECCTPAVEKPKMQLINLAATAEAGCTPGGGCC